MGSSKMFYGGTTFNEIDLNEANRKNNVALEYYKIKEETTKDHSKNIFGVEIIKKEYLGNEIAEETKTMNYIAEQEEKADQIIEKLYSNKVTPMSLEDVMTDLLKTYHE